MNLSWRWIIILLILSAVLSVLYCIHFDKQAKACEDKGGTYLFKEHKCMSGREIPL